MMGDRHLISKFKFEKEGRDEEGKPLKKLDIDVFL